MRRVFLDALSFTAAALIVGAGVTCLVATASAATITYIPNGGTGTGSFATSGNGIYYNGTSLATAPTTGSVTYPYASTTAISSTGSSFFATASGNVGIGTTSPYAQLSIGNLGGIGFNPTATSTFGSSANGISLTRGCFSIQNTCIGGGTVSSILTNNGLTGGPISTTGTIGLDTSSFSTNAVVAWNGSKLVATGTPQLTVGNLVATSTATSTFAGALGVGSSTPFSAVSVGSGQASSSVTVAEYKYGVTGNAATTTTANIDCNASNQIAWPLGSAATTMTLRNMTPGKKCVVVVQNPNSTAGALTWGVPSNAILMWSTTGAGLTVAAPTQVTGANQTGVYSFLATQGSTTMEIIGVATQ